MQKKNQRRSLDAYQAASLEKEMKIEMSSPSLMDMFGSSRKAKTVTRGDSKRDQRQTFAHGVPSRSLSAKQLRAEDIDMGPIIDLPNINIASTMAKKKTQTGVHPTKELPTYKLEDILISDNDNKVPLTAHEQRRSYAAKPTSKLPNISPTEKEVESVRIGGISKSKSNNSLTSIASPTAPTSGSSTPGTLLESGMVANNSVLLRLKISGGTIIAGNVAKDAIEGLGLQQKELKILKDAFDKIDIDKNCCITQSQLFGVLEKMGYQQTTFTTKVYELIDIEGNGNIEFGAFVRLSGTFLMFSAADLVRFVFQSYNNKRGGMFGEQDYVNLTADINTVTTGGGPRRWADVLKYDNHHEPSNAMVSTVGPVDIPRKGHLTEEEFVQMSADYPQMLSFAVQLQTLLQDLCLGERFYQKLLNRQDRARAMEEYKATHLEGIPTEEFSMNAWFRKVAHILRIDDEPDVAKRDNSKLLEIGFSLYTKLHSSKTTAKFFD